MDIYRKRMAERFQIENQRQVNPTQNSREQTDLVVHRNQPSTRESAPTIQQNLHSNEIDMSQISPRSREAIDALIFDDYQTHGIQQQQQTQSQSQSNQSSSIPRIQHQPQEDVNLFDATLQAMINQQEQQFQRQIAQRRQIEHRPAPVISDGFQDPLGGRRSVQDNGQQLFEVFLRDDGSRLIRTHFPDGRIETQEIWETTNPGTNAQMTHVRQRQNIQSIGTDLPVHSNHNRNQSNFIRQTQMSPHEQQLFDQLTAGFTSGPSQQFQQRPIQQDQNQHLVDQLLHGFVPNPIPQANHHGSMQQIFGNAHPHLQVHNVHHHDGLTDEQFDRLTCFKQLPGRDDICSICQDKIEVSDEKDKFVVVLPCLHRFHNECIHEWLKIKRTCPIDNVEVKF
ncbi:MAG: hypothetical protein EZS28_019855 [Streblomastix strix]|uniref:RING-type domain-containing protein n=1 Tax=Streblomastix strix TaxID=222440 RepID=A0A5J4VPN4_9EUKA|nr:MAG: hypothetical protein EZS28_019855 [Streblomastix strix]